MSKQKIQIKLKKILSGLLLAVFALTAVNFASIRVDAFGWNDFTDLFETGDQGPSFVQYQGGLAELDKKGFDESLTTSSDAREFILRIVDFALGFLGLVAVIIIIYGGVIYVTAAGEQERTEKGKKAIAYATIGLLIVLGSFAFVNTVIRGATGDESGVNGDRRFVVGQTNGGSFNAMAEEVKVIATEIYTEYILFSQSIDTLKAIQSDLDKSSLKYEDNNLVSKNDMIEFLYSAQTRLQRVRDKVPRLSDAYNSLTNTIREVDKHIDEISRLKKKILVDDVGQKIEVCDPDKDFNTEIGCKLGGATREYIDGLFEKWNEIRRKLINDQATRLQSLVEPLRANFLSKFDNLILKLQGIQNTITGVEAVDSGEIGTLYNEIVGEIKTTPDGLEIPGKFGDFREAVTAINDFYVQNPTNAMNAKLYSALESMAKYYELLRKLQAVVTRLRANVVQGSAPLLVTFDVLESVDPAGGAITKVDWSKINGLSTFEGNNNVNLPANAVSCDLVTNKELVGPVFNQCLFNHPGTYTSIVKIESNDPRKYVAGQSALVIKVLPPNTEINLDLKFNDKTIPVISYYNQPELSGVLRVNRDRVPVTLDEAKNGINFDISNTKNIKSATWNFGDGTPPVTVQGERSALNQTHKYEVEGKYVVSLEVVNQLNQVDRKIFTLEVGTIAARINISPEDVFINTPIRFNSEQSSSSIGQIRSYEWKLQNDANQEINLGTRGNRANFIQEFQEPGKYTVSLTVTNDAGQKGEADPVEFLVRSRPPVAAFDYNAPKQNQPSTIHLSAAPSFDPDGSEEFLEYHWQITPDSGNNENWEILEGDILNGRIFGRDPIIRFNKIGNYEVKLKVIDSRTVGSENEESNEITQNIKIDNILDVAFAEGQSSTAILSEGKAEITFNIISRNGIAYEIDFGDGESDGGSINDQITITHTYREAGRHKVEVRVYDEEDNGNSITRTFVIGSGEKPVAKINLSVGGEGILDLEDPVKVSISDTISFNASDSKNTDGTGRDLLYQWDFGDKGNSSQRVATHKYKEFSPPQGFYTVTLTVTDKDDPTKKDQDTVLIDVGNKPPKFSAVQGLITSPQEGGLITPITLDMRVYGAEDEDGDIVKYKWWYFDVDDPEEKLGIIITNEPTAKLTIGTRGREGQKLTYGFGLEVTDNFNATYSNERAIENGQYSTIEVINGKNTPPVAKFNVSSTSANVGDEITFTSASTDDDGQIRQYIWDFEGDGFFNNDPTDKATITHRYQRKKLEGYEVKLKVIDDKGGEAVSEPIKVFIDSNARPPEAAFTYTVIEGSNGMKIQFKNNSKLDKDAGVELLDIRWDFDTKTDSDGDGKADNDIDSREIEPKRLYTKQDTYNVKLTITDTQGNTDDVVNPVKIPLADPPQAAFRYSIINGKVAFQNNSKADPKADAKISKYSWDFDIETDSDGDGETANDTDSELVNPIYQYPKSGTYGVKLSVTDNQGNTDDVTNSVQFLASSGTVTDPFGVDSGSSNANNTPPQNSNLRAVLYSTPAPGQDGIVHLSGNQARVQFYFGQSLGNIATYKIDKNIHFDTSGDGVPDNDEDFVSRLGGTWVTNFERQWGKIVVRLTVSDNQGKTDTTNLEIKFD